MDKAAMLTEIVAEWGLEPVADDEMTLRDLAQAAGVGEQVAARCLRKDIAAGKFTVRKAIVGGRQVNVYRRCEHL